MAKNSRKKLKSVDFLSSTFPSYITSHSKPQYVRKYIASKERMKDMDKKAFYAWGEPKSIPKSKQSWPQAKIRQPNLKPMVDSDGDGVINLLDCRPFNKRKQGFFHRDQGVLDDQSVGFEDIKKLKTIRDVQKIEEDILRE